MSTISNIELVHAYNSNFSLSYPTEDAGLNFNHKLGNFDEFTAARDHFKEFGRYTKETPNRHPKSAFMRFWKEEKRRSIEGHRDARGEWIPGYYYWYLNYQPIQKVVFKEGDLENIKKGKKIRGERVTAFPDIWDYDYYWYHYLEEAEKQGKHAANLKSRGKGYSFKGGAMINRNVFLIPNSLNYVVAYEKGALTGQDGILSRAFQMKNFVNQNTAFWKYFQRHDTPLHYKASKVLTTPDGRKLELGYQSEVTGIPLKGDADRARGKRGKLILWEEGGNNPVLDKAWQIARESVEQDAIVFGLMVAFGTAGSNLTAFNSLRNLFEKPRVYNILPLPNIWSKRTVSGESSFFVPSYTNLNGLMDRFGNTAIAEAYQLEADSLEALIAERAEPQIILQRKQERPKHPEEALLKKAHSIFPIQAAADRLAELELNPELTNGEYVGRMRVNSEGIVEFIVDPNVHAVPKFPHDIVDKNDGAIVIWEKPKMSKGKPLNIYIAGGDPYDQDKSTTMSLGSTFIMNVVTGKLVAEYTGRPDRAETYWEQVRLLLMYYDAKINFENDLIGFRNHMINKKCSYLLLERPSIIDSIHKDSKTDREFGTPATTKMNQHHRLLSSEWMKTKVFENEEITYIHTIESKPLLQEIMEWDLDGNYDRVSALGMLMIHYEEVSETIDRSAKPKKEASPDNDPMWDRIMFDAEDIDYEND